MMKERMYYFNIINQKYCQFYYLPKTYLFSKLEKNVLDNTNIKSAFCSRIYSKLQKYFLNLPEFLLLQSMFICADNVVHKYRRYKIASYISFCFTKKIYHL